MKGSKILRGRKDSTPRGLRMNLCTLVFLFILLPMIPIGQGQEPEGSITYTPSAIPEIGFNYNPEEYAFDLTWKTYYLTIRPFASYNGHEYTLKEIKRIRKSSFKIKGEISHVTDWYRYVYLNTQGSTLYGKIVNSITKQLTNQNFYSFLKKEYGPDISKIDMKKAEEY